MTTLSVKLPNSIQRHLQEMADLEGVPVEQFVANAVSEKISVLTAGLLAYPRRAPASE